MKLTYTYVVLCNDKISSLGFSSEDKAIEWLINNRNCKQEYGWNFKDEKGNNYKIIDIQVK